MFDTATHQLSYVEDRTVEATAKVDEDGNVVLDSELMDVLDVHETNLWCSTCGQLGWDEYADHGIAEDWEVR